jgi:arylsulfatase
MPVCFYKSPLLQSVAGCLSLTKTRHWLVFVGGSHIMMYYFRPLLLLSFVVDVSAAEQLKPNIVLLLADNLGYNDVSIFGAPTAKTPNIDRLGHEGIKLNNWNSAAHLCSASRAAILTGKYPARMGIYPRVFKPDAVYGLLPSETTLAEYLKAIGYATSVVGKWHLGHRPDFLPTNQGFDEWLGVPYHMSGGSIDGHECFGDENRTMWLPLYRNKDIVEQPVQLRHLAQRYASKATDFLERNVGGNFFLFMSFSHVHQLCAPKSGLEQETCQWSKGDATFVSAVEEMDWIAGQILDKLDELQLTNDTLVIFTSDNGPWVAEQECAGNKGPFEGRWLQDNVDLKCTACPSDYQPDPRSFRKCILPGTNWSLTGVHCGVDSGLGSVWEANLRMPALARWPSHIPARSESMALMSSLDIVPTILSILGKQIPSDVDGMDVSQILFDPDLPQEKIRVLFFWRDGFAKGPLPAPFGRFDVAAIKMDNLKAWIWTKSGHYNDDVEVYHDPPLLFDVLADPAEAFPLKPNATLSEQIKDLIKEHKASIPPTFPLALPSDPKYLPCFDVATNCRTSRSGEYVETVA